MTFRNYLAGIIFLVLLILGPIDHSWSAWLVIRIGYVILIPLVVWYLLGLVWNYFQPSNKLENTLKRILSGIICYGLLTFAFLEANSKTHIGNTRWIRTRDGMEAVGDDIVVQGPDWGLILFVLIITALVFWFGVLKRGAKIGDQSNTTGISGVQAKISAQSIAGIPDTHFDATMITINAALESGLTIAQALNYSIEKHNLQDYPTFNLKEYIMRIEQSTGQPIGYRAEPYNR